LLLVRVSTTSIGWLQAKVQAYLNLISLPLDLAPHKQGQTAKWREGGLGGQSITGQSFTPGRTGEKRSLMFLEDPFWSLRSLLLTEALVAPSLPWTGLLYMSKKLADMATNATSTGLPLLSFDVEPVALGSLSIVAAGQHIDDEAPRLKAKRGKAGTVELSLHPVRQKQHNWVPIDAIPSFLLFTSLLRTAAWSCGRVMIMWWSYDDDSAAVHYSFQTVAAWPIFPLEIRWILRSVKKLSTKEPRVKLLPCFIIN
jgi:hypothetical protein